MKQKAVIRLFYTSLAILAVVELLLVRFLDRTTGLPVIQHGWVNALLGLPLIIVGCGMVIWSVSIQHSVGMGTPAPRFATQKLVVSGPYAYTRNPMTLGAALLYLGIAAWAGSTAAIGLVLGIFTLLLAYIYVHETRELAERFGPAYLEYKRKTPFLLPRLKRPG